MTEVVALRGKRVLVAEDEYFIADEVVAALEDAGAVVVGPVATLKEATRLAVATGTALDAAILDVNLHGEMIWPVLDALSERGILAVLATGYDAGVVPSSYAHLPRCEKPIEPRDLLRALARGLRR